MRHHIHHRTRFLTSARIVLGCLLALATWLQVSHEHPHVTPAISVAHAHVLSAH